MKLHDKLLICAFVISLVIVLIFELIAKDAQELFFGGSEIASILVNLSLSCAAGCIIYYISSYIPAKEAEKKITQDQLKVDEITSIRLKKILDSFSRILIVAHNNLASYQEIMALPIREAEFKRLNCKITASNEAVIGRPSNSESNAARSPITIAEFISEEIESIKIESEKILRLEKYISADLIKILSELEDVPVINNWKILIDEKPMLINGVEYYSPKGSLSNYFSFFEELDTAYKKIQKYMYVFSHTGAGNQYCLELDTYYRTRQQ